MNLWVLDHSSGRLWTGLLSSRWTRPARFVVASAAVVVSTSSTGFSSACASSVESKVSFPLAISFSVVVVVVVGAASVVTLSFPSSSFIFLPSSGNSFEAFYYIAEFSFLLDSGVGFVLKTLCLLDPTEDVLSEIEVSLCLPRSLDCLVVFGASDSVVTSASVVE